MEKLIKRKRRFWLRLKGSASLKIAESEGTKEKPCLRV